MLGLVSLGMMSFGVSTAAEKGVVPTPPVGVSSITPAAGTSSASAALLAGMNLLKWSQAFVNGVWSQVFATPADNQVKAPDGTTTASKLTENTAATAQHRIEQSIGFSPVPYTFSVYVAPAGRTWVQLRIDLKGAFFDVQNGVVGSVDTGVTASIAPAANGFYRCSITYTPPFITSAARINLATGNNSSTYTGDGVSALYVWGAQLDPRSSVNGYCYTAGSPVIGQTIMPASGALGSTTASATSTTTAHTTTLLTGALATTSASSVASGPTVHEMVLGVAGTTNASSFVSAAKGSETILGKNGTVSASAVSVAIVGHPAFTSYTGVTSASSNAYGSPEGITHVNGVLATTFYMNRRRRGSSGSFLLYPTPVASLSMQLRAGSTFVS